MLADDGRVKYAETERVYLMKQTEQVLEFMRQEGSITTMDAFVELGITRLSAVIFNLKEEGYKIKSTTEKSKNRYGRSVWYSRYM